MTLGEFRAGFDAGKRRVLLPAENDDGPVDPREKGELCFPESEDPICNEMIVVSVDIEFIVDNTCDDGFREVGVEQIEWEE